MHITFAFEVFAEYCLEINVHPVLSQHKVQLIELFLM